MADGHSPMSSDPKRAAKIGQAVPRYDGRLKVTGGAKYASDHAPANVAHGYLHTSSIAKGRIRSIDESAARAVPGVLDVFTYQELPEGGDRSGQDLRQQGLHGHLHRAPAGGDPPRRPDRRPGGRRHLRGGPRGRPAAEGRLCGRDPLGHLRQPRRHREGHRARGRHAEEGRRGCGLRLGRREDRCALLHPHPASQPDRALHHHLRLGGAEADGLGGEPERLRLQARSGAAALHQPGRRAHRLALHRRGVRQPRIADAAHGHRGAGLEGAGSAGEAGDGARPGLHRRHLPRRDPPPRAPGRIARRQARVALPRGLGGLEPAGRLQGGGGGRHDAHVRLPQHRLEGLDRLGRPQHAGLHALAAGGAVHVRAGERDGRAGLRPEDGPGGAASGERHAGRSPSRACPTPRAS